MMPSEHVDTWHIAHKGQRHIGQSRPSHGGGAIIRPKPPVFARSWRSPSKNTVKNSTEDTCSWTRPSKIGKRKVKNPVFFNFLTSIFWFATSFFAVPQVTWPGGGFLSFWTRFRTDFRRFVIAETLVFTVFFCFLHAWRLASKLPKPRKLRCFMLRCEWKHRKYRCFLTLVKKTL